MLSQAKRTYRPVMPTIQVAPSFNDLNRVDAILWDKFMDTLLHFLSVLYPEHVCVVSYPENESAHRVVRAGLHSFEVEAHLNNLLAIWERTN